MLQAPPLGGWENLTLTTASVIAVCFLWYRLWKSADKHDKEKIDLQKKYEGLLAEERKETREMLKHSLQVITLADERAKEQKDLPAKFEDLKNEVKQMIRTIELSMRTQSNGGNNS